MARVLSVNVGLPREITWRGETVFTSVWKEPVQGRRLVRMLASRRGRDGRGQRAGAPSDMRFASRESAVLSQWEVGAGLVPGGGSMAPLPRLIGGGRALEVLLGAGHVGDDLAER